MQTKDALIIFIKTPQPYQVKTRLQPQLTAKNAAVLYSAFLQDLNNKFLAKNDFDLWYAVSPEGYDQHILNSSIALNHYFLQQGNDIGKRMGHAFQTLFAKGYEKAVLIGSDIPAISSAIIKQAFQDLKVYDCVLGPSKDGGYYLIALKQVYRFLFSNVPWSTVEVLEVTLKLLKNNELDYKLLSELQDIDDYDSLLLFYNTLKKADKRSDTFPLKTWDFLSNYFKNN
jgi:rSAM/selenodomain-associated transferase 1